MSTQHKDKTANHKRAARAHRQTADHDEWAAKHYRTGDVTKGAARHRHYVRLDDPVVHRTPGGRRGEAGMSRLDIGTAFRQGLAFVTGAKTVGIFSEAAEFEHDTSDIIRDILARHRSGQLGVVRARSALTAFVTSLAPDGFITGDDMTALDVYLDITLEVSKHADAAQDQVVEDRVLTIQQIANGDVEARTRLGH